MKKYNKTDETLVQIGVSLRIRINTYLENEKEFVEQKDWSKAAGWQNLVAGMEITFKEISEHFGDYSTRKQQFYQYNDAVNSRLKDITLLNEQPHDEMPF